MKYRVLRDCYGFKGAYWEKGQLVDLSDHETPPSHFEPLEKPMVAEKQNQDAAPQEPSEVEGEAQGEAPLDPPQAGEADEASAPQPGQRRSRRKAASTS